MGNVTVRDRHDNRPITRDVARVEWARNSDTINQNPGCLVAFAGEPGERQVADDLGAVVAAMNAAGARLVELPRIENADLSRHTAERIIWPTSINAALVSGVRGTTPDATEVLFDSGRVLLVNLTIQETNARLAG